MKMKDNIPSALKITEEIENEIKDMWAISGWSGLKHELFAVDEVLTKYPKLSKLTLGSIYYDWLKETNQSL